LQELEERSAKILQKHGAESREYKQIQLEIAQAKLDLADATERETKAKENLDNKDKILAEAEKKRATEVAELKKQKEEELQKKLEELKQKELNISKKIDEEQKKLASEREKWETEHSHKLEEANKRIADAQDRVAKATDALRASQMQNNILMVTLAMGTIPSLLNQFGRLGVDLAVLSGTTVPSIGTAFTAMSGVVSSAVSSISSVLSGPLVLAILGVVAVIVALKIAWDNNLGGIQEKVAGFVKTVNEYLGGFFNWLKKIWNDIKPTVFDSMSGAIELITGAFSNLWNWILKPFVDFLISIFAPALEVAIKAPILAISLGIKGLVEVIKFLWNDMLSPFIGFLKSSVEPVISSISNIISGFINTVSNAIGKVKEFLGLQGQAGQTKTEQTKTTEQPKTQVGQTKTEQPKTSEEAMREFAESHGYAFKVIGPETKGEKQYGGLIPLTGIYKLEAGEIVMSKQMLSDLVGYTRRLAEIPLRGAGEVPKGNVVYINSPLVYVEGHVDEKLAKQISEVILKQIRRVTNVY
ncbi:MAG: hypothetical protein ACPLYF_04655, partial [Fervidobacterium sp.]